MSTALHVVPASREHYAEFRRFFAGLELDDPVPDIGRWSAEIAPWAFFLAEGEKLVGYAFSEVYGDLGYVRHVVTSSDARRRGVGLALMRELAARFRAAGATRWGLNVKRDNRAAIALYARCGMYLEYATHVLRFDWAALPRLPRTAKPLLARIVDTDHDRDVEAAFRLPDGKVARLRGMRGNVLMQLIEREAPIAFARFDPAFPGCFPFKVQTPDLVRQLLEALAPHAREGDPWIQMVVEDDEATAALLLACGAHETLEIVHMGGVIPSAV